MQQEKVVIGLIPLLLLKKQLQKAASFIREEGASAAGVFDITMPSQAWIALQATDYFKTKAKYQVKLFHQQSCSKFCWFDLSRSN